jgi:hypothetical protein
VAYVPDAKRRRLVMWGRGLWVPGLVVAAASFTYNWLGVPYTDDGYGFQWAAFPLDPGTIFFVVGMLIVIAGMVLRRAAARPSEAQHAAWVAAWIGTCGVLLFGIGWGGSSFFDDWGFGGGEVTVTMGFVGALVIVIALFAFLASLLAMFTSRVQANRAQAGGLWLTPPIRDARLEATTKDVPLTANAPGRPPRAFAPIALALALVGLVLAVSATSLLAADWFADAWAFITEALLVIAGVPFLAAAVVLAIIALVPKRGERVRPAIAALSVAVGAWPAAIIVLVILSSFGLGPESPA